MFGKIEHIIEVVIFRSRWLLAPFFLGLIVGIILLLIKFIQELVHLSTHVITATDTDIIIGILTLVDMSLVGALLLMIIFSGYEIFVSKIDVAEHADRGGPGLLDRISAKLSYRLIDVMPHSFCYQGHAPDKFLHYCKPHPVFVH